MGIISLHVKYSESLKMITSTVSQARELIKKELDIDYTRQWVHNLMRNGEFGRNWYHKGKLVATSAGVNLWIIRHKERTTNDRRFKQATEE
jgi:hypothetical protein